MPPPREMALPTAEVHVFRLSLDVSQAVLGKLERILSVDERLRASRFMFDRDRKRFTVGRATLRTILGLYLGTAPAAVGFRYEPFGKPALDAEGPLRFNLSHSADLALVAVTSRRKVGVDVERMSLGNASEEIAAQSFSPAEMAALARLAPAERHRAFYRFWTRKEAYVKARGDGLSNSLPSFDVSLEFNNYPCLFTTCLCADDTSFWTLADVEARPGFAAALAIEGAPVAIRHFDWQAVAP